MVLVAYWLLTAISGIDSDYDIDIDVDADFEIDGGNMDFEDISSTEVDRTHVVNKRTRKLKWWQVFLIFFNFVGLPFMFTFTVWIFIWWLCTLTATSITGSYDNSFGFVLMLSGFIPALFLTKIFTSPFRAFFKNLNKNGDLPTEFIGREALLLSTISGEKMGNAEVVADGNPMSIYVKSLDGSELRFRESVLIIKQSKDKSHFLVSKV